MENETPDVQPEQPERRPSGTLQNPKYQQPIQDMGATFGFGQTPDQQHFEVPQPAQPMAQLRQERLQQFIEQRMRRRQRAAQGEDATGTYPWRTEKSPRFEAPAPSELDGGSGVHPLPAGSVASPSLSIAQPLTPGVPVSIESSPDTRPFRQPSGLLTQDTGRMQKVTVRRATMILTVAFVASRVLGLLRSSMFTYVFGANHLTNIYYQAFLVPDFIFNIVSGGALSSAFIPVFTNYMIGEGNAKKAWHIASSALNLSLALMTFLAILFIIFARQLVPLYSFNYSPAELDQIANLTRVMLLQSVILGGGVIVTAVLNARQNFKLPAIGTVLYNVGLIVGLLPGLFLLLIGQRNDNLAMLLATWGVVLGAALQVIYQIPGLFKVGMQYSARAFDWKHPGVIQIARQMVPRIMNSAMVYLSTFVDRTLISLVVDPTGGGFTLYNLAFSLVLLPYGIFGLSAASAAFPMLAENVALRRFERVRNTILETLRSIIFLSVPSSIGLIILGLPVLQVLYQHGSFTLNDAQATAVPLAFYALGLPALAAVEILVRSFYAMRDTRTPVIVSIAQFIFKIALSITIVNVTYFGMVWGLGALALATSIANLVEAGVLLLLLHRRLGGLRLRELSQFVGRVIIAVLPMTAGLLIVRTILDTALVTTVAPNLGVTGAIEALIKLLIETFVGVFLYVRMTRWLKIEELSSLKRILDRLKLSWI